MAASLAMLRRVGTPAAEALAVTAGRWRVSRRLPRPAVEPHGRGRGMSSVALETLGQSLPEKAQYDAGQAFVHAKFGTGRWQRPSSQRPTGLSFTLACRGV